MFRYRCGKELLENDNYCSRCRARRSQNYQKETMAFGCNLSEGAIRYYFNVGYSYNSVTIFLNLYHDISISIQTLKTQALQFEKKRGRLQLKYC